MLKRPMLLGIFFAALTAPVSADSIIIDFESLRQINAEVHHHGAEYFEDGFRLSARHFEPGNPWRFNTLGTLRPEFTGSTTLFNGVSQGEAILTRADGGVFDLISIDLYEMPSLSPGGLTAVNGGPFHLEFFALRQDGSSLTTTFLVDNFLTPTTYMFTGFTDVVSVNWFHGPITHQFDNIAVVTRLTSPSTLLLLASGLFLLHLSRFGRCRG